MRTLVVLPTFNEAENIAQVLGRVREAAPEADVLVVDDASPDGTAALARQAGERLGGVEVLRRGAKGGLGSAYRAGFEWGIAQSYDVLVEMDADLSHDPAVLPTLLDILGRTGAALVVGSRYVPGGSIPDWSLYRRLLSRWGNRYASLVLALPVRDATSGYRAYRADALARLDLGRIRADGYGFQIEMVYAIRGLGYEVVEHPIAFTDRVHGTSKMSGRIVAEALTLVTWWAIRDRVLRCGNRHGQCSGHVRR